MIESGEIKKCYQWKTGFWASQVESYLAETEDTVFFESGRSIKKDRLESDLVQIPEELYLELSESARAKKTLEDQWKDMLGNEQPIPSPPNIQPTIQPSTPIMEKSPVQIILERQKKKEKRVVHIEVEVNIPSEKVIDLLTTMFDEDEVFDEIVSSSIELNEEDIRNLIRRSIIKQLRGSDE